MADTKESEHGQVPETADAQKVQASSEESGQGKIEAPVYGFDRDGYFVVKVHSSLGYHALQGHLDEAKIALRAIIQAQQKERQSKIITPGVVGTGKFKF